MIKFTVPGKPQGKARPRFSRGHTYTPEKTSAYETVIAWAYKDAARKAGVHPYDGNVPIGINITAIMPIPKSKPKYQREKMLAGQILPTVRPDWDNISKAVCDALNGVAYKDDAQITKSHFSKIYGDNPRLEVEIYEVSEML